jgi:hypothetical protein
MWHAHTHTHITSLLNLKKCYDIWNIATLYTKDKLVHWMKREKIENGLKSWWQ